jgi:hypothetical protein
LLFGRLADTVNKPRLVWLILFAAGSSILVLLFGMRWPRSGFWF